VNHHSYAIARKTHIKFDSIRTSTQRRSKSSKCVFRRDGGCAAMADNQRFEWFRADDGKEITSGPRLRRDN
jgi:hypothetical protein